MFLYRLFRETKPKTSLEIGLAYGYSTIYILAALQANGGGHHVAVDPYAVEWWHGIGITREQVLGLSGFVECCQETSAEAFSRFAKEHRRFDVIFIDGDHRFDAVMVDFSLAASVCSGYIVLDDAWMPSVRRALSFIRTNRKDFSEIPSPPSIAAFKKTGTDERPWDDFVDF